MLKCSTFKSGKVVAISNVNGQKIKRLFTSYEDAAKWHNRRIKGIEDSVPTTDAN